MRARTESAREVRMIGTRAPRTMSGRVRLGQECKVLGQHVAGFEIGHDQDLRAARNSDLMPLIFAASGRWRCRRRADRRGCRR